MRPNIDLKELASRESEQVEWKENVADIESVLRTVTAFSNDLQNMGGGYVVCGAAETKDEYGFQKVSFPGLSSSRFKEIENKVMADARSKIDPAVIPIIEELPGEKEGSRVLVFIVPATRYAHSYRPSGKDSAAYYVRLSRETVEARNGVLRELLVRKQALESWDRRLNERAKIDDIDLLTFRDVLQQIGNWNPSIGIDQYFSDAMRVSDFVPALGGFRALDNEIHPRNFALVLFGKEPTRFFPGAWTKVSYYPGKDRSERTAERYDLTGTILSQARKALELLKTYTSTLFDKESTDPNAPKYPERALQEAVINAIVHRDYEQDEPTSITVFADRLEIRSPGALPRSVNKDKFVAGRASPSWRNQSLAYFFNRLQLAQAEGQGIPTIIRTMLQLGSPAPKFDLDETAVTCILPAHPRHELMRHVSERSLEGDDVRRVAVALRKVGKDEQSVELISRYIATAASPLAIPAVLLEIRAHARIDLAKKCMETGRARRVSKELKTKAWERCRNYLDEAEADILRALEIETRPHEKEFYQKDLDFVRVMKETARKPPPKPGPKHPRSKTGRNRPQN